MAALGWRSLGAVASVLTWHMPAEVFAAPSKKTVAPMPTKERRLLQQYSNYDVIKAKTFKESGATFREVFEKFGVPERSSQDDGRRSGARAIGQTELPGPGCSSIARGGEGRDGEQDGDSDCRGLQPPPELPLLKCPHHITLLLVYNADGYYYPPIIVLSRSKTAEKMGKKKKPQLYNLRNPVEQADAVAADEAISAGCLYFLSFFFMPIDRSSCRLISQCRRW